MQRTPIEITLYGKGNDPLGTYQQSIISLEMMLRAEQLIELLEGSPEEVAPKKKPLAWFTNFFKKETSEKEQQVDAVTEFVATFFNDQFTKKDVRNGADFSELMSVIYAISARTGKIVNENPTKPSLKTRQK